MVAVEVEPIKALLLAAALAAGPLGLATTGAQTDDVESSCQTADDGSGAIVCDLPDECQEDPNATLCEVPSECDRVDETTFRCAAAEDANTTETRTESTSSSLECEAAPDREDMMLCHVTSCEGQNTTACIPPDCERVDDQAALCPMPEGVPSEDFGLLRSVNASAGGPDVAHCRPSDDGEALVCEPSEACRNATEEVCGAPSYCEPIDEHRFRCYPQEGQAPPDRSQLRDLDPDGYAEGGAGLSCEPGPEPDTMICTPPAECQGEIGQTEACTLPSTCQPRGDGTYLCEGGPGDERRGQAGSAEVDVQCEPGPERGTVVCQPPEECKGQIGQTERCTPPPTCQRQSGGSFLCQIPDRAGSPSHDHDRARPDDESTGPAEGPEVDTPDATMDQASSLFGADAEAREQARAEIATALNQAAQTFRQDLKEIKSEYRDRVDELRAEYQQGKEDLREEYESCRSAIPENVSGDRSDRLRACLDDARQGIQELKANLSARHDEIASTFKDRAEDARSSACETAEQEAINAVARHGLFDANPADVLPERALELCPTFADFGSTQEGQR